MKYIGILFLTALTAICTLEASSKKKKSRDPAHAATWAENPKTYEGKKVASFAFEIGDFGQISSENTYCAIPVTTCNAAGVANDEIIVIIPTAKAKEWVESLAPKAVKGSAFGKKMTYAPLTGLFVKLNGENALVIGDLNDEVKKITPSKLVENQKPNPHEGLFGKPKHKTQQVPKT